METGEFLAAVLPPAGVYCIAELSTKKKEHVFGSLEELKPHIERFNEAKLNTYFALASFSKSGKRSADNALLMRSFFLDIDCGKGKAYPNQKEAVTALEEFLYVTGMPNPWAVSSGSGVHVYWPFTEAVGIAEWKTAAENLKLLCKKHDLKIDYTVTADSARVLRVPDTFNWKDPEHPRRVVIKLIGAPQHNSFAELTAIIGVHEEAPEFSVPGKRLDTPATPSLVKVLENRITFFKTILDRTAAGTGCEQLKYYIEHASEDGMEPLWRGMLSLAKVCNDGDKAAKHLSKLHPYSDSRMRLKLREIKGPYPCTKFNSENPGICPSCQHWNKVTNPLVFGHEIQVETAEKQVHLPATEGVAAPSVVTRPVPPSGFAYGSKGGIFRQVDSEDNNGNPVKENRLILPYDLFVVELLNNQSEGHLVQMIAMRPEGPVTLTFPQRSIVSKEDTIKALAEQNVLAAYGSGNDKFVAEYVRACVENVSSSRRAIDIPTSFGWQADDTFVYNGKVYSSKGEKEIPMPKLANIIHLTTPKGSLERWKSIIALLVTKEYYDILAMMLVSVGSPLMRFTGFTGLTFHVGSSETGTGKSLSLGLAASVWGSPQFIISPKTSAVTQEHRIGGLGSLPLIIDEITEMNKDFDWISTFVMDMTSGLGKDRLKSATNEERRNFTVWCALMLLASNTHTTDFFSGVRKKAAEGHLRRLLELKMDKRIDWSHQESETVGLMRENYGVAGHAFVQWLVHNVNIAQEVTRTVHKNLKLEMEDTGDERFWMAGVAAAIAGGVLLGKEYANIVELPMKEITLALKNIILSARQIVKTSKRSAEDILNAYTREFFGQFVVVQINDKTKQMETSYGNGGTIDQSITRTQVRGRVEHDIVPGHINYYIEEQQLKAWCSSMNYGYVDFKRQLEKHFVIQYGKKDMLSKTRGPQMRVNVIKITRPETTDASELEDHVSLE